MAKWKCKICKQTWNIKQNTCLNCEISRNDLKKIWVCPKCKEVALENERCPKCNQKQKTSVKEKPIISRNELIHKLKQIKEKEWTNPFMPSKRNMQTAFISLLYLTGARVSELCFTIRKRDIDIQMINDKPFLIIYNIPTLKKKIKGKNPRTIPINIEKEKELIDFILDYLNELNPQDILFPFGRRNGYLIIYRHFGKEYHPHYFRHLRLTHLVQLYNFDALSLQNFTNWSSIQSSYWYISLGIKDLAQKML